VPPPAQNARPRCAGTKGTEPPKARCFLNRVRRFDSCRGHVEKSWSLSLRSLHAGSLRPPRGEVAETLLAGDPTGQGRDEEQARIRDVGGRTDARERSPYSSASPPLWDACPRILRRPRGERHGPARVELADGRVTMDPGDRSAGVSNPERFRDRGRWTG